MINLSCRQRSKEMRFVSLQDAQKCVLDDPFSVMMKHRHVDVAENNKNNPFHVAVA